jgi:hypothetical protein
MVLFEISVILQFDFVIFALFWAPKSHLCRGRRENKEKRLFYFDLRTLLPIQIQLLDIENLIKPKLDSP